MIINNNNNNNNNNLNNKRKRYLMIIQRIRINKSRVEENGEKGGGKK